MTGVQKFKFGMAAQADTDLRTCHACGAKGIESCKGIDGRCLDLPSRRDQPARRQIRFEEKLAQLERQVTDLQAYSGRLLVRCRTAEAERDAALRALRSAAVVIGALGGAS